MTPPTTLNELFFEAMDRYADRPVYQRVKRDGRWVDLSYRTVFENVQALAAAFRELGILPGDRIAILSENRPEWVATDFACLSICGTDVPVYPTLPSAQAAYILQDSAAVAICCSTAEQLAKVLELREGVPSLRHIIVFDDLPTEGVRTFAQLLALGRAAISKYPDWRREACTVQPHDLATLIYTSGTTGPPKGVMLSHGNIASNVAATITSLPLEVGNDTVSFLPLSHIFERMAGLYTVFAAGVTTNFAESMDTVVADIQDRRPHHVAAVPRVFEKIYTRALDTALSAGWLRKRIFFWAKRQGEAWVTLTLAGQRIPRWLALQRAIADRLVFSKLRARVGNRIVFWLSGGAPLSADIARFFFAAGMPILEGYGLTETSPVISLNTMAHVRLGTVGRPIEGVEVRIAEDGEILCRGPNVMMGYYNRPDATAEAIDTEGWFHTGDIGLLDDDGFLQITDRKKDLIVTAGGKNIAPQPIENRLKTNPMIANAVMLGDRRRFPLVLLVPEFESVSRWARAQGLTFTDQTTLVALPAVIAKLEGEMKKHLRDLAHFEVPKKVILIPRDFTIEQGEMTPKMSVRRKIIEEHFREDIDAAYAEPETC